MQLSCKQRMHRAVLVLAHQPRQPTFAGHDIKSAMTKETRRYGIWIVDIEADRDVVSTVVDWTDDEKRMAIAQVMRWTGVSEDAGQDFVDMITPAKARKPQ